ncbi:hypothetical protein RchiOBHm_Chr7g0214851 [Rosa chinensis]|uniref:Uncharacterized protein n=1 Tax=Rosa chinensis TaxID=74649 RepID=A0A2P6PBD2_ROSCH|nr:hypothetical protein RchiOBHm_Chr7g0214851 [Rosa chinensis]
MLSTIAHINNWTLTANNLSSSRAKRTEDDIPELLKEPSKAANGSPNQKHVTFTIQS